MDVLEPQEIVENVKKFLSRDNSLERTDFGVILRHVPVAARTVPLEDVLGECMDYVVLQLEDFNLPHAFTWAVASTVANKVKQQVTADVQISKLVELGKVELDGALRQLQEDPSALDKLSPWTASISLKALRNARRTMEDRHVVIPHFNTVTGLVDDKNSYSYYAVFDGHGGREAANYCAAHLHIVLAQQLQLYPGQVEQAIKAAFKITDKNYCDRASEQARKAGSTAVIALVSNASKLYVGWLGDSEAVLAKGGKAVGLVKPHKPSLQSEQDRITELGGEVVPMMGIHRVNGNLAVSRAVGDLQHKPFVCSDADVTSVDLDDTCDFMVLACDGLFDSLSHCDVICNAYHAALTRRFDTSVAEQLTQAAISKGSTDNVTTIVVNLRDPKKWKYESVVFPTTAEEATRLSDTWSFLGPTNESSKEIDNFFNGSAPNNADSNGSALPQGSPVREVAAGFVHSTVEMALNKVNGTNGDHSAPIEPTLGDLSPPEEEQRELMAALKNDIPEADRLNPDAPEFVPSFLNQSTPPTPPTPASPNAPTAPTLPSLPSQEDKTESTQEDKKSEDDKLEDKKEDSQPDEKQQVQAPSPNPGSMPKSESRDELVYEIEREHSTAPQAVQAELVSLDVTHDDALSSAPNILEVPPDNKATASDSDEDMNSMVVHEDQPQPDIKLSELIVRDKHIHTIPEESPMEEHPPVLHQPETKEEVKDEVKSPKEESSVVDKTEVPAEKPVEAEIAQTPVEEKSAPIEVESHVEPNASPAASPNQDKPTTPAPTPEAVESPVESKPEPTPVDASPVDSHKQEAPQMSADEVAQIADLVSFDSLPSNTNETVTDSNQNIEKVESSDSKNMGEDMVDLASQLLTEDMVDLIEARGNPFAAAAGPFETFEHTIKPDSDSAYLFSTESGVHPEMIIPESRCLTYEDGDKPVDQSLNESLLDAMANMNIGNMEAAESSEDSKPTVVGEVEKEKREVTEVAKTPEEVKEDVQASPAEIVASPVQDPEQIPAAEVPASPVAEIPASPVAEIPASPVAEPIAAPAEEESVAPPAEACQPDSLKLGSIQDIMEKLSPDETKPEEPVAAPVIPDSLPEADGVQDASDSESDNGAQEWSYVKQPSDGSANIQDVAAATAAAVTAVAAGAVAVAATSGKTDKKSSAKAPTKAGLKTAPKTTATKPPAATKAAGARTTTTASKVTTKAVAPVKPTAPVAAKIAPPKTTVTKTAPKPAAPATKAPSAPKPVTSRPESSTTARPAAAAAKPAPRAPTATSKPTAPKVAPAPKATTAAPKPAAAKPASAAPLKPTSSPAKTPATRVASASTVRTAPAAPKAPAAKPAPPKPAPVRPVSSTATKAAPTATTAPKSSTTTKTSATTAAVKRSTGSATSSPSKTASTTSAASRIAAARAGATSTAKPKTTTGVSAPKANTVTKLSAASKIGGAATKSPQKKVVKQEPKVAKATAIAEVSEEAAVVSSEATPTVDPAEGTTEATEAPLSAVQNGHTTPSEQAGDAESCEAAPIEAGVAALEGDETSV